jgi:hypothetical protein
VDDEIQNAIYIWQLGRLLKYQHENGDLREQVTKSEWRELERYFRLGNLPTPDRLHDAAIDILVVHRTRMEAADPELRDRVAVLVDRVVGWEGSDPDEADEM